MATFIPPVLPGTVIFMRGFNPADIVSLVKRLKAERHPGGQVLAVPLLCLAVFGTMMWMLKSGVLGWAVGYCSAKLVADSFILFLPLIAKRARAEEAGAVAAPAAAPTASPAPKPRKLPR